LTLADFGFLGEHEHRVDPQGRISIPARFRESFKSGFVLAKSPDKCISVYPPSEWQIVAADIARASMNQSKNRRRRRVNFSGAYQVEADRQGRFHIPQSLREHADIKEDIVLTGMGTYLEIWAKESWVEEELDMNSDAWLLTETAEYRDY